jgi:HD-GYP domain-containing protein (c-di-GMP phosphodiesterase class II)
MAEADENKPTDTTTSADAPKPKKAKREFNKVALAILAATALAIAVSIYFTLQFIDKERERDRLNWQVRLGIVADFRAAAVNQWVEEQFGHMRELTQNASLQLYLSEAAAGAKKDAAAGGQGGGVTAIPSLGSLDSDLGAALSSELTDGKDKAPAAPNSAPAPAADPLDALDANASSSASVGFLRNLLIATAERTGFKAPPPVGEIAANIERPGVAGIGLIDINLNAIVSTPDMPPLNKRIRDAVRQALQGDPAVIDIFKGPTNEPTMGFVLPIFKLQEGTGAKAIGAVVGIKIVDEDLFKRLKQPGELSKTSESFIARKIGNTIEYLTPLADGTKAFERQMAMDTPDLAAAYALEKTGGFAQKRDYAGVEVLVTSRSIANVPNWVLVRKVTTEEALASTETRLRTTLIVLLLIIGGVSVSFFAVWAHGASVRAKQAMADMKVALERFSNMSKFMKVVTDSQPTEIVAVDGNTTYTFANAPAAKAAGIPAEDFMGKSMAAVIGPVKAQRLAEINNGVLRTFEREQHISTFTDPDADPDDLNAIHVIKSDHIPLRGDRDFPPGVLMVLEDISELSRERRRSERMMRQLIDTLISVVDRRDPYSAHHSTRTAEVAREIAEEMGLSELEVHTVDIAGSLMNLGKIFVPPEVLTKTGNLTDEERELLASTYLVTADLLRDVTFEGPVVKTVLHMGEHWDGTGRFHISGDRIIPTAQVLAVANAFVGMASARAWRPAMEFRKVIDILMQETGSKFDHRPVSALMNFLENRGGIEKWAHFRDPPASDKPEH